jgi:hypothetical protein
MRERQRKIFSVFFVLSLILVNYQNCGSAKNAPDIAANEDIGVDGNNLGVINPVVTGGIQFSQTKATVESSDQNLNVFGVCSAEQNGAFISWVLEDASGIKIFSDKSLCDRGVFAISFEGVEALACNSQLQLKAFFGAKAKTQIEIQKNCN